MKVLFDTNILIDHLAGVCEAGVELNRHFGAAISVISWVEIMTGVDASQEAAVRLWLDRFHLVPIDADIAVYAAALRAERRLDLADALIVATAQATGRLLITRDLRLVHETDDPPVHLPYELSID
ncbi:PIN domain-containing protein [Candidatus Phycosocius spiralis]|uniref:Ribonuclease VapC n=1 Tax=Candidatus Phycosocius spiralis TaxID=2815099 RepID=A0ABQ4PTX3_9PROT|nr:PIN domain-containing protein [Candidatus Phycosocius spiralis]GIU66434.1 ribonuclease VapC [Candidatus Phycosocius spiralis]